MRTVEYYSAIKECEIMSFAATWINLEIIRVSEVRKRKTNTKDSRGDHGLTGIQVGESTYTNTLHTVKAHQKL